MHRDLVEGTNGYGRQKADSVGGTKGTATIKQGEVVGRLEMWPGKIWVDK